MTQTVISYVYTHIIPRAATKNANTQEYQKIHSKTVQINQNGILKKSSNPQGGVKEQQK